jgi:hypothetical protein
VSDQQALHVESVRNPLRNRDPTYPTLADATAVSTGFDDNNPPFNPACFPVGLSLLANLNIRSEVRLILSKTGCQATF